MPEAITGTPWVVVPKPQNDMTYGWTDVINHQMGLPEIDQPNSRFVRLHELGHAKYTPKVNIPKLTKKHDCKEADLQCVEDMRINSLLVFDVPRVNGRPVLDTDVAPNTETNYIKRGEQLADMTMPPVQHLEQLCWFKLQHKVTYKGQGAMMHGELTRRHALALNKYINIMYDNKLASEKCGPLAESINRLSSEIVDRVSHTLGGTRRTMGNTKLRDFKSTCKASKLLRKLIRSAGETLPETWGEKYDKFLTHKGSEASSKPRDGEWGQMTSVDTLPLVIPHRPQQQTVRTKQAVPLGARLGHIRRLITDGRAFSRIRKKPMVGGTVLIDASGSMHITSEEIMKYLNKAPSSTVAMYSAGGRKGVLTIIAKNGRMATEEDIEQKRALVGRGNVIDGPALDWLSKQAEPRIWVCDGYVTGISDLEYANLFREAAIKCKRGNIKRYDNLEEATKCNA